MKLKTLSMIMGVMILAACTEDRLPKPSPIGENERVVLRVAHFWPATAMSQKKVLEPWCATITEQSGGQMTCQFYPAMQLGGTPAQLMDLAQDGIADIVFTLPGYTPGRFPIMEVMELPFMTIDGEYSSRVAWQIYQEFAQEEFAMVKPLAFNVHDRGQILNNRRPITKIEDFKGLKLRAPTRLTNKMVEALGATPVSIPMPALTDATSKGVVDGVVLPWEVIPTLKLQEVARYASEINAPDPVLYSALFTISMNKYKYEALPPKLKKIIDDNTGANFSQQLGRTWDEQITTARQKIEDNGNPINQIASDEVARIQEAAKQVEADWITEMNAKGYDGQAIVNRAKELIAEAKQAKDAAATTN